MYNKSGENRTKVEVFSLQKQLPDCFLGKKVYLEDKKAYTIKYQDNRNNDGIHVLLFDNEKPVIFAIMKKDGSFHDAFFISKKTNNSSVIALNRYQTMINRKVKSQVTQDELKDALRSREEAKMKNENISKLLVDEHLEDISNGWSSRLLYMQRNEFKTDESLIIYALREALQKANPHKAFYFLTLHRYDNLLPELIHHLSTQSNLLENIFEYYSVYEEKHYLFHFLKETAKTIPLTDTPLIQSILSQTYSHDLQRKTHYFKTVFLLFYKRTKTDPNIDTKSWLNQLSKHSLLKQAIHSLKRNSN